MTIGIYCTNNLIYPTPNDIIYANMDIAGSVADELSDMGHNVTFFAPKGTQTKANLETFGMEPFSDTSVQSKYSHKNASYHYENIMLVKALNFMSQHNFDIFHSHTRPYSVLDFAALKPTLPSVLTVHDPITDSAYDTLNEYNQFGNLNLVSLSFAQRTPQPSVQWAGNVYNGIDVNAWEFNNKPGNYLLYTGRILPEKGVDTAIQVTINTGLPLKIAGTIYDGMEDFFDEKIKPYLSEKIEYLGAVDSTQLVDLYKNALAFINPIRWPEPFGLVMIEAMASGTPVISTHRGSVPEIVIHEKTGFIANDPEDIETLSQFVRRVGEINREECRNHVENSFSKSAMAKNYIRLYLQILANSK